jgi:uncharacterized protein YcbK (DUF882 family)
MGLHRRAFLRMGGGALVSAIGSSLALPVLAQIASPALVGFKSTNCRTLSFDCLHTGEKLKTDYWVDGNYVPDALEVINRALRDFRTGQVHAIEPKLLDLLAQLGQKLETSSPFQVISGFRSPATNAMLHETTSGVASNSLHMEGKAIDVRVAGQPLARLHDTALAMKAGGVGYYPEPESNFVHVDIGRVRHWS